MLQLHVLAMMLTQWHWPRCSQNGALSFAFLPAAGPRGLSSHGCSAKALPFHAWLCWCTRSRIRASQGLRSKSQGQQPNVHGDDTCMPGVFRCIPKLFQHWIFDPGLLVRPDGSRIAGQTRWRAPRCCMPFCSSHSEALHLIRRLVSCSITVEVHG